jgi:hypothetical protein
MARVYSVKRYSMLECSRELVLSSLGIALKIGARKMDYVWWIVAVLELAFIKIVRVQ